MNASAAVQAQLETDMMDVEENSGPHLPANLQNARTVPPSQAINIPQMVNQVRYDDAGLSVEERVILFRMQHDPDGEVQHQRRLHEKRDDLETRLQEQKEQSEIRSREKQEEHVRKMELAIMKKDNEKEVITHKQQFRTNSSTRSRSTVSRQQHQQQALDPNKILVHPQRDAKNPVTVSEGFAVVLSHYLEPAKYVTDVVDTMDLGAVLDFAVRSNHVGFETFCGRSLENSDEVIRQLQRDLPSHLRESASKTLLLSASEQFPKITTKKNGKPSMRFPEDVKYFHGECLAYVKFKHPEIDNLVLFRQTYRNEITSNASGER